MAARRTQWPKGVDVHLISPARLQLALAEADNGEGVSLSELARASGLKSHAYLSRLARGVPGAKAVKPSTADAIAKRLGVETQWLFQAKVVKSVDRTAA
jgi:hypothetical protein